MKDNYGFGVNGDSQIRISRLIGKRRVAGGAISFFPAHTTALEGDYEEEDTQRFILANLWETLQETYEKKTRFSIWHF